MLPGQIEGDGENADVIKPYKQELPGQVEENEDEPPKLPNKSSLHKMAGVVVGTATTLTDRALQVMGRGVKALDEKVPDDTFCSRCLKRCQGFQDPVQMGRCSVGRLGFSFLALLAFGLVLVELMQGLGSEVVAEFSPLDDGGGINLGEVLSNVYVFCLALFCAIVLGGDIFMFEAFLQVVNSLQVQVNGFRKQNDALEEKLDGLGHVEQGLQEVYNQMEGDIEATTTLLLDLDRFGKLQTVGAVVNQYFASDIDGSGHISGPEAQFLIPQLTLLWEMVPNFDKDRFALCCQDRGLRLPDLAMILDTMVNNDVQACYQALELFCNVDAESEGATNKKLVPEEYHQSACFGWLHHEIHVIDLESEDGFDIEANRRPKIVKSETQVVAMAPPSAGSAREVQKKEPVALEPLFSISTPSCLKSVKIGPFSLGDRCSIWGWWHLIAFANVPISLGFLVWCVFGMEIPNIILATIGFMLTLGLTGTGKMLEVLRALRKLLKELQVENVRLKASVADLGDKVQKLAVLQHGFEKLQEHCSGNVAKAKTLIQESNTKVKMSAMAVVTHLMKHAGLKLVSNKLMLDGEAVVTFFTELELVFSQIPGFDISAIQEKVGKDQIDLMQVKSIVDIIASFAADAEDRGASGDGQAATAL